MRDGQRRLAAILAADVVGYSRLMAADEAGTLARLKSLRAEVFEPKIAQFQGRIVGSAGDSLLIEFASAVNAVECAVELQEELGGQNASLSEDRRMAFRMGVNLGDVIAEDDTIHGDGVNVAARLEKLAEPGGVCVGRAIYDQVKGKLACAYDDLGEQHFHNIPEPVHAYRVERAKRSADRSAGWSLAKDALPARDRPSIAVLPFTNMSGDLEQEYFSDGITEDVITDLSRVSALFVVARNTSFMFKGKSAEIVEAARKLNVSHILEGSVRKAGNRVRISVQLIDGATCGHIWAERYDRDLGDIFTLQDEISKNVVAALKLKLLPDELKTITTRSTTNAEAYQCYLLARATFMASWGSRSALRSARELFVKAATIDPGYARAYAGMADCDASLWVYGDLDVSYQDMLANSNKALELAPNLAEAHASKGVALYLTGHGDDAAAAFERALELEPDLFEARFFYGFSSRDTGLFDRAAVQLERAAELSPSDCFALCVLSDVHDSLGRHELSQSTRRRAIVRIETALHHRPDAPDILALGAVNLVELGEFEKADEWARRAVALDPENYILRYNAGCTYAVSGKPDAALENLEYICSHFPRARRWLLSIMDHDIQWRSLRDRADFQDLVKRLQVALVAES